MVSEMKKYLFLAIAALLASFSANAEIKLPALIGDGMVLQRDAEVNVWGNAAPSSKIKIVTSWDSAKYVAKADSEGAWQVKVSTPGAGGPYSIEISENGKNKLVIEDILIGEVWLCSGQSNMEMPLMGFSSQPSEENMEALLDAATHRKVRLCHLMKWVPEPNIGGHYYAEWRHCDANSAGSFSALGYYFATRISDILDVPVGMIEADWGGTRIEAWMSVEAAQKVVPNVSDSDKGRGEVDSNRTGFLWDTMIVPCSNYTLRGFLWYQGESNNRHPSDYAGLMKEMVSLWRGTWKANGADAPACIPGFENATGGEQMPFFYAQLAPFNYNNPYDGAGMKNDLAMPLMWEAQLKALKMIPNSNMAVNVDLGSCNYIHPPYKKQLADRFVLMALHDTYGEAREGVYGLIPDSTGPIFKSVSYENGHAIVEFESNSTLYPANVLGVTPILGFEIAGEDRVFHKAEAVCVHDNYAFTKKVDVYSPDVPEPVAVRYAFHNLPGELNLTNTLKLPAFPFRTDDWND